MHRPCGDEEGIALADGDLVEDLLDAVVADAAQHLAAGGIAVEPDVDERTLFGTHDIPHLVLAVVVLVTVRIPVGGMHLDGEVLAGVDKLDHAGKLPAPLPEVPRLVPADRVKVFAQRQAGILARRDDALPVRVRRELPALRNAVEGARVLVKDVSDLCSAPDVVLKDRREADHFVLYHILPQIYPSARVQPADVKSARKARRMPSSPSCASSRFLPFAPK